MAQRKWYHDNNIPESILLRKTIGHGGDINNEAIQFAYPKIGTLEENCIEENLDIKLPFASISNLSKEKEIYQAYINLVEEFSVSNMNYIGNAVGKLLFL